jgi:hypothetical protein
VLEAWAMDSATGAAHCGPMTSESEFLPGHRAAGRPEGAGAGPADRRPLCRQDPGRLRRRGGQDRAAGQRRPAAQVAPAEGRHLGVVAGAVAQQALAGAGPAPPRPRPSCASWPPRPTC